MASDKLYAAGYRNMAVLDEGIPGWYRMGFPIETGAPKKEGRRRSVRKSKG